MLTPPDSPSTVKSEESKPKLKKLKGRKTNIWEDRKKSKKSKKSTRKNSTKNPIETAPFQFVESFSWNNNKNTVYDVKFNRFIKNKNVFATAFKNTVCIYECNEIENDRTLPTKGTMKKLIEFESEKNEFFYTIDWSYDQNGPILAAAGEHGFVHIFSISNQRCKILEGHSKLFA